MKINQSKEWYKQSAAIEGDSEVGAGCEASNATSRVIADNPTPAVREKLGWLDERDRLDRLARECRS